MAEFGGTGQSILGWVGVGSGWGGVGLGSVGYGRVC